MKLTTLGDVLTLVEKSFESSDLYFGHGTNNAWDEAVALALFVLKLPPDVDKSVANRVLTEAEKNTILSLATKRIEERIPLPYMTHEAWFAGLKFYVDERVIIPRSPIGELIVNQFQPWLANRPVHRILDLCTGSGCIAIACAMAFKDAKVDAVDISKPALEVAKKNVELHGCIDRVNLIEGDLFSSCLGQYDIIISNPPYVDSEDMRNLPKEFLFEPPLALAAGQDGLSIVRHLLKNAPHFLSPEGLLFVEVGNSAETLQNQYPKVPFTWIQFELGGHGVFMLEGGDKTWQVF